MSDAFPVGISQEGRPLSGFTVELDVYSGPYEWLLALILKDEVEIFEVSLREIVDLYLDSRTEDSTETLERDTEFVGSASSLVLMKSRTLSPILEAVEDAEEEPVSPAELAERLVRYLKVRRGAEVLRERFEANAGYHPTAHALLPRPGRLEVRRERLEHAARRVFSRPVEPSTRHLGPITVTIQELATLIRSSLARGPLSYEELVRDMDRMGSAVAFAAALSMAQQGQITLSQPEPLGPLTFLPNNPPDA